MFKLGKTMLSSDSPEFFQLPNVPVANSNEKNFLKPLRSILKLNSSLENPLNNNKLLMEGSLSARTPISHQLKPKLLNIDSEQMHSFERISDPRPLLKNNSDYQAKYNSVFKTAGFGISSNISDNQFSNPRIIRNESERLLYLKNTIEQKQDKKHVKHDLELTHRVRFTVKPEYERKAVEKKSQTQMLNLDIEEFEHKLEKIKAAPVSKQTQQELYHIQDIFTSMSKQLLH